MLSFDPIQALPSGHSAITAASGIHYSKATPQQVTVEDITAAEQVRLLARLNDKYKSVVMSIIDTMLTKQKFQEFFQQNFAAGQ